MSVTAGRPAPRALAAPAVVLAAVAAATTYVGVVSPDRPGHYPVCPFLRVTGWWCPACGGLRCVHALTRGDLGAAVHDNVLVVVAGTVAALVWLRWSYRSWRGLPTAVPGLGRGWMWAVIGGLLVFAVLRNTPWGTWLAPPVVPV
ncbi:DUF2752 domain-containing protein [Streptacidiphilus sp. N1-12]|uniref:DUF2752 domain-containing protein n=2 Tax=Streptacidiphilus alkalitolerans TaxID=3342712 RepID=A0ABV6VF63_9ACTN